MEPVAWIRRKAELHLNVGGEPLDSVLQGPQVSNFLAGGGESTLFLYVGPPPEQGEEEKEVEGKESGEADSASGGEAAEVKQSKTLPSLRTQTDETAYLQASLNKPPPLGRDVARAMYFIRNDSVPLPGAPAAAEHAPAADGAEEKGNGCVPPSPGPGWAGPRAPTLHLAHLAVPPPLF